MNIETKIKRWLKLLTLKALRTTGKQIFQIKQNIVGTIKHYSEISGHLLKISSIASVVIIVASFITYNYFFFTNFKKIPEYNLDVFLAFGVISILAFVFAYLPNHILISIVIKISNTKHKKSNKIIKNFILRWLYRIYKFVLNEFVFLILMCVIIIMQIHVISYLYALEIIEHNLSQISGIKTLPIIIFILICIISFYTKIFNKVFKILWILVTLLFYLSLDFNIHNFLGNGNYKADITILKNDPSYSYIFNKLKEFKQEQITIQDDGNINIKNITILFDLGNTVYIDNIFKKDKHIEIKKENVYIDKL